MSSTVASIEDTPLVVSSSDEARVDFECQDDRDNIQPDVKSSRQWSKSWTQWDPPDVVATQGAHLLTRGGTPVFPKWESDDFAKELYRKLDLFLAVTQETRRKKYGVTAAEEWPMRHTPPELRTKYQAHVQMMFAIFNGEISISDSEEDTAEDKLCNTKRTAHQTPSVAAPLLTPSPSNTEASPSSASLLDSSVLHRQSESPIHGQAKLSAAPCGKKRRLSEAVERPLQKKSRSDAQNIIRPRRSLRIRKGSG